MTWTRWMQSSWLCRVVAALMSLSMGTPAVWAYGHELRPPSAQQTPVQFLISKQLLQETFLPEHTLSRQVFEQTGVLLVDRALVQHDPSVPLFLERYLTQVAVDAKERSGVTLTLEEAAKEAGIKLVWYDPNARSVEEARQGLERISQGIHAFSEKQFA